MRENGVLVATNRVVPSTLSDECLAQDRPRVLLGRLSRKRVAAQRLGLPMSSQAVQRNGKADVSRDKRRIRRDAGAIGALGFFESRELVQREAESAARIGVARHELRRAFIGGTRFFVAFLVLERIGKIQPAEAVRRVPFDEAPKRDFRVGRPAQHGKAVSYPDLWLGIIGIYPGGGLERGQRPVMLVQSEMRIGEIDLKRGITRPRGGSLPQIFQCCRMIAFLKRDHPKKVQGVGVSWGELEDLFAQKARLDELPFPYALHRGFEERSRPLDVFFRHQCVNCSSVSANA